MKKHFIYPFLATTFATLIILACRKDLSTLDYDHSTQALRTWYNTYTGNQSQNLSILFNGTMGNSIKSADKDFPLLPDWDKSITYSSGDSSVTEIPIKSNHDFEASIGHEAVSFKDHIKNSILRLVIITTPTTRSAYYVYFIGNTDYTTGAPYDLVLNTFIRKTSAFSGRMLVNKLDGAFFYGYKYEKSLVVGSLRPGTRQDQSKSLSTSLLNPDDCTPTDVDIVMEFCHFINDGDDIECNTEVVGTLTTYECDSQGGTPPPPDCSDLMSEFGSAVSEVAFDGPDDVKSPTADPTDPGTVMWFPGSWECYHMTSNNDPSQVSVFATAHVMNYQYRNEDNLWRFDRVEFQSITVTNISYNFFLFSAETVNYSSVVSASKTHCRVSVWFKIHKTVSTPWCTSTSSNDPTLTGKQDFYVKN